MRRVLLTALLTVMPLAAAAGPTNAPPPRPAASTGAAHVDVRLGVVHATKKAHGHVDPRLGVLSRHLGSFPQNDFRMMSSHRARLAQARPRAIAVPGDRNVSMTLLGSDKVRVRVRVRVERPDGRSLVDTTASIPRGRTMMLAGPHYGDGILLLPITVSR